MKHASPLVAATLAEIASSDIAISTLETAIKREKDRRKYLQEHVLVELVTLEELNNGAILPDGTKVRFEHDVKAGILAKDREDAHHYLITEGYGALLRNDIIVSLGKESEEETTILFQMLTMLPKVEVSVATTLPGATLMKWIRTRLSAGKPIPDLFNVYAPMRAVPVL